MVTMPQADVEQIHRAMCALAEPGQVVEARLLNVRGRNETWFGYFDNFEIMAEAVAKIAPFATGGYFTLNPVKPDLLTRAKNLLRRCGKGEATSDGDIIERRWLPIDLDPIRPPKVSATDAEHEAAIELSIVIRDKLGALGWPLPVQSDSGNGAHLLYRIDQPREDGRLIENVTTSLANMYDTPKVKIDCGVYNASRIWKLPGTVARKGDNTSDRPHRVARMLDVPDQLHIVTAAMMQTVIDLTKQDGLKAATSIAEQDAPGHIANAPVKGLDQVKQCTAENKRSDIINAMAFLQTLGSDDYDPYSEWLHVGMELHSVSSGPGMLAVWDEWSQQSDKYQKGECAAKWATFKTDGNGKKRTIASLAKRVKDSRRTSSGKPMNQGWVSPTSDIANGKRMARLHGDDLFYTEAFGWFTWDGRRFKPDETGQVLRFAKQTSQFIASEAGKIEDKDERDKMLKHASRSQDRSRLEAMVWAARSEADIAVMPDVFDRDAGLFNIQNGTLDLLTMQLKPHDRSDRITKVGGAIYDPDADCPAFKAFLHEIFKADADLIAFYQRLIGYMLTALTSEQGVYILWGSGANGKSVLLKTQSALMGDYAVHTPGETFMVQKNPSVRSDVARLAGARLVTSTEVEDGQRLAETLIKQFSGEDKVTARKLYKAEFEFEPCCKIFIAANHKPVVRGTDYAIWRRINLIPFTYTVPKEKRIPQMAEKRLIPELSGILNWALAGLQTWRDIGLNPPECVTAATAEYKTESDVLADWIEDHQLEGPGSRSATNSELRKSYLGWCEVNGITKPLNDTWFGRKLAERGYTRCKIGGERGWRGIGSVD